MIRIYLSLFLFLIPFLLIFRSVYELDKNKESNLLIAKNFIGGITAVIIVFLISLLLKDIFPSKYFEIRNFNLLENIIYSFLFIALIEESSRLFMTFIINFNNWEFDETYDGIIYSVVVALGFSFLENMLYIFQINYQEMLLIIIIRSLLTIIIRVLCGIIMGIFLSKFQSNKKKSLLFKSLLITTIIYGLYNFILIRATILKSLLYLCIMIVLLIIVYLVGYNMLIKKSKFNKLIKSNRLK